MCGRDRLDPAGRTRRVAAARGDPDAAAPERLTAATVPPEMARPPPAGPGNGSPPLASKTWPRPAVATAPVPARQRPARVDLARDHSASTITKRLCRWPSRPGRDG